MHWIVDIIVKLICSNKSVEVGHFDNHNWFFFSVCTKTQGICCKISKISKKIFQSSRSNRCPVLDIKTLDSSHLLSLFEVSIASSRSEKTLGWKFSFPNSKKLQIPDSPVVDMKTLIESFFLSQPSREHSRMEVGECSARWRCRAASSSDAEHSRPEERDMPTAVPGSAECWIGLTVVHSWDPVKIAETH